MRSGNAAQHERITKLFKRHVATGHEAGLLRMRVEDHILEGGSITLEGRKLTNFGTCAYSGLNTDERLKRGAIDAITRFGPVFSSSTAYTSIDLYSQLEERLSRMFEASVIIPTTTSLGHLSALPALVKPGSVVLVDSQAHSSIHMATQVLQSEGIEVVVLPHNDVQALEVAVAEATQRVESVWYLADGVYSMLGDTAPVEAIESLLERYENLWVYFDDAHGVGWSGKHGRGVVLERMHLHPRMVVIASLAKSIGAGGAVLVFADPELAAHVQLVGGPMSFSGPLHPAELGAAVAAIDIMLSDEQPVMRQTIGEQIDLVIRMGHELGLPLPELARTPIWFVRIGSHSDALEVGQRMVQDGFYLNIASFPAVPYGHSGLRFTHTMFHELDQIETMLRALSRHLADVVGENIAIDIRDEKPILDLEPEESDALSV